MTAPDRTRSIVPAESTRVASESLQGDRIRASAVDGAPTRHVAARAGGAELLVLGRGGDEATGLGPVAEEVLGRAPRATVVVPPWKEPAPRGRVLVGLRDSRHAADALAVGFAEANRRGAELIVTVIRDPAAEDVPGGGLQPAFHTPDDQDAEEADHLPRAVADLICTFPRVPVTTSVRTGHFADVLVELSRSADLLVLGLGGRSTGMGRKDLLIASHSTCPVIVVRETPTRGGA